MTLALVRSRALSGLQASAITVEVHLANGLPSFTLVGLADVEVKEARERVRSALLTCGLDFPHNKRITVNLAPADLPTFCPPPSYLHTSSAERQPPSGQDQNYYGCAIWRVWLRLTVELNARSRARNA